MDQMTEIEIKFLSPQLNPDTLFWSIFGANNCFYFMRNSEF